VKILMRTARKKTANYDRQNNALCIYCVGVTRLCFLSERENIEHSSQQQTVPKEGSRNTHTHRKIPDPRAARQLVLTNM